MQRRERSLGELDHKSRRARQIRPPFVCWVFHDSTGKEATLARQDGRYRGALRLAITRLLPTTRLPLLAKEGRTRWTDLLLALCAILMTFSSAGPLKDRFDAARRCLLRWYPGRRRPGRAYEGFIAALRRRSGRLLKWIGASYRVHVQRLAEQRGCWHVAGWLAFGVDSTKHDAPMTASNEQALGTASKKGSWPQLLLTTVFHLGSGLPWSFLRGRARSSERRHLLGLLRTLPSQALLVADAGFVGYDFWSRIIHSGRWFLTRVGSNVRLIQGFHGVPLHLQYKGDGIVWVWPDKQQKRRCKPLVLRLIPLTGERNRTMYLLTNVLERQRLDDAAAVQLDGLRWGVELMYRSLKQTLSRRKLLSDSPRNAPVELSWTMIGLWTLALIKTERCQALPPSQGVAAVLRVLRRALAGVKLELTSELARLKADTYQRTGSKKARHWPHKKREKPPAKPKARNVTEAELLLAEELAAWDVAA